MFKMVSVTKEQAKNINKPIFISNEDVYLVHLNDKKDDELCFTSNEDFKIIHFSDLKDYSREEGTVIVDLKEGYPNLMKLEKFQEGHPNFRFTGSNLIENCKINKGVLPKEVLEKRLLCKIKDNKSFIHQELISIVPFSDELEIEDFIIENVSIDNVRFGKVGKFRKSGSKKEFKSVYKKKKRPIFEEGKVEF